MPYCIPMRVTDAPGCKHACTISAFACGSYVHRPSRLRPVISRCANSVLISGIYVHVVLHGHVASSRRQPDGKRGLLTAYAQTMRSVKKTPAELAFGGYQHQERDGLPNGSRLRPDTPAEWRLQPGHPPITPTCGGAGQPDRADRHPTTPAIRAQARSHH